MAARSSRLSSCRLLWEKEGPRGGLRADPHWPRSGSLCQLLGLWFFMWGHPIPTLLPVVWLAFSQPQGLDMEGETLQREIRWTWTTGGYGVSNSPCTGSVSLKMSQTGPWWKGTHKWL